MYRFAKIILAGFAVGALAGCAGLELENARNVDPKGSAFTKGLYKGYVTLAASEQGEADYRDADAFALRAISAAGGKEIGPENIASRALPKPKVGELSDARARLMAALEAGARSKAPAPAANAQVMFDCWMQEQEENFQPKDIARCRGGFMTAMAEVDEALKPKPVAAKMPAPKMSPPMRKAMPKPQKQRFVVYFPFDGSKITPASTRVIMDAIDAAKSMGAKKVYVSGHTDRAGADVYNYALSEKRAEAVAATLTGGGILPRLVGLGAFGEANVAVQTKDNVPLAKNRRVEIEISN